MNIIPNHQNMSAAEMGLSPKIVTRSTRRPYDIERELDALMGYLVSAHNERKLVAKCEVVK